MTTPTLARLESVDGAEIVLESVDVQANLQGLISEVTVTQIYRNLKDTNIEAVYTFPLPLDAVLLDLSLDLNGRKLRGAVKRNEEAEENYEDAMVDGDSAVLLKKSKLDLFTINVGNLLPNERATVEFKYAQLHHWQGDSLRFHLPTTIAPRYGDPVGLAEHEVPEYALSVDRGFSLTFRVGGELALASFECPSHSKRVSESTKNGVREFVLSGGSALMDRDFILVVKQSSQSVLDGLYAQDNEEHVALASFHPVLPEGSTESARCVKLVVDCSGSMSGDSIDQAKDALHEILPLLRANDFFNLITFGSDYNLLFPEPVPANESNIKRASQFIDRIDADMGGTQIGAALEAAYECGSIEGLSSDLLLITDGNVWDDDNIIAVAQKSRHRIFSVGVGSAVSEGFVRSISESTSGACELVSPRENMSERIVRHFRRIHQPRVTSVRIEWPEKPIRQVPDKFETVYAGDTLHVFAWFNNPPGGNSRLVAQLEDGRTVTQEMQFSTKPQSSENLTSILPKVAAHTRLQTMVGAESAQMAVDYQLVTEHTSYVLVVERSEDEKLETLPILQKVDHALAAGYGGMSTVCYAAPAARSFHDRVDDQAFYADVKNLAPPSRSDLGQGVRQQPDLTGKSAHRAFLRSDPDNSFSRLIDALNVLYADESITHLNIDTFEELILFGLDQTIVDQLMALISDGTDESNIVICFLMKLSNSESGKELPRHVKRLIRKANKKNPAVPVSVSDAISRLIDSNRGVGSYSAGTASL